MKSGQARQYQLHGRQLAEQKNPQKPMPFLSLVELRKQSGYLIPRFLSQLNLNVFGSEDAPSRDIKVFWKRHYVPGLVTQIRGIDTVSPSPKNDWESDRSVTTLLLPSE